MRYANRSEAGCTKVIKEQIFRQTESSEIRDRMDKKLCTLYVQLYKL
jgi:hypothetical protein